MKNVTVLFSGGLDSMALAEMARSEGRLDCCLFIDYGQAARFEEKETAISWCEARSVDLLFLRLPLYGLDAMNAPAGEAGPRIVPGRNLSLIAAGVNVALTRSDEAGHRYSEVWIGCTAEDRQNYPDCRQAFINPLKGPITKAYNVDVWAPFLHTSRAEIIAMAEEQGWDLSSAWSCYRPENGRQCGRCDSCRQESPSGVEAA